MKTINLAIEYCIIFILSSATAEKPSSATVKVNRTVPQVEPPKPGLEFSAKPTTQEIFRVRIFEEPLVPIGGEPAAAENADLAVALLDHAKRSGPDDFASLTGFLAKHPKSPWRAALLTGLGLEYHNTGHYSLALEACREVWSHASRTISFLFEQQLNAWREQYEKNDAD